MAGILKNQLVKRLASFTKGLSVEKIDLDILSGRGYLDNLELDEQFMTSVLELPHWMSFTKILCSKIRLKVTFTKLSSEPIRIFIDTVYVEADIGKQRTHNDINIQQKLIDAGLSNTGSTSYGYMEQVIDGMHISVATIRLNLTSKHHLVTTELSGVELVSTNRKWKADDLRRTRAYINSRREEVLVYKMLTISHARFEFFDKTTQEDISVPPLRFNFNMLQVLITMKKLVSTNEVLSASLKLIMDDILLVFTPSQLQILLAFSKELSEVVELSAPPPVKAGTAQQPTTKSFMQRFSRQNQEDETDETVIETVTEIVLETSYHLKTGTIDILFCDDESTDNGSLQLRFEVVQIDLFPHRTGNASRRHWVIPVQYVKDAQVFAAEMLGDFAENHSSGVNILQNLYEMVVVLRCDHFQLLPVMGSQKRRILGPMLLSDKKKFGLLDTEPALVVTVVTYYSDTPDSIVPPQNMHVHLNPTEVNLDIPTIWWLRQFLAATMTEDFKYLLTDYGNEESRSQGKLKIILILPHITIPITDSSNEQTDRITGLQFWFSKLIINNLTNALYLPLLTQIQDYLENSNFYEDSGFPHKPSDGDCLPTFKNVHLIPDIIEKLCKQHQLRQQLLEERSRQRSPRTARSPNSSSPDNPGTPESTHSRRSSLSSINISYTDSLPTSPLHNISDLLPELDGLVLGLSFENFSADFLYATDPCPREKYRSRKFITDVPLQMWLMERSVPAEKPKVEDQNSSSGQHRKLCRNTLKRQSTLTSVLPNVSDYMLLLKSHKSIHCMLDRHQYLFLTRLQREMQSFVEKIILSFTQIFTSNEQGNTSFTFLSMLEHLMIDISLPASHPVTTPSLPDTASTSLSHLSSPSVSSRHSVCEDEIVLVENEKSVSDRLSWVALSRSDSNIASLSERLSQSSHYESDDAMSITSLTHELNPLAKGDSKETLLKFIMRVNKKRDTVSVGCQTAQNTDLVANNYQQLHGHVTSRHPVNGLEDLVNTRLPPGNNTLQIHCGLTSISVHSFRDVITKVICQKILITDEQDQIESKARCFPFLKWRGRPDVAKSRDSDMTNDNDVISRDTPQICVRIKLQEKLTSHDGGVYQQSSNVSADNDATINRPGATTSNCYDFSTLTQTTEHNSRQQLEQPLSELTTSVVVSNLMTHFNDSTLDGLGTFFGPDPSIKSEPISLECEVVNCEVSVDMAGTLQKVQIPSVKVELGLDETWVIGVSRDQQSRDLQRELEVLRRENEELRRLLELSGTV